MCFAGPSDDDGPRTVIGMNASPQDLPMIQHDNIEYPWDPHALYELKLDLNDDFVEDITWRFTFPTDPSTGTQYVQVAQLNGPDATSRTAPGTIITPPNAPVGRSLTCPTASRSSPASDSTRSSPTSASPRTSGPSCRPPQARAPTRASAPSNPSTTSFAGQTVRLIMVELPARITGLDPIQCWGSTAIFDTTHTPNSWVQVQRAAGADVAVVFGNGQDPYHRLINATGPAPTSPRESGGWSGTRSPGSSRP